MAEDCVDKAIQLGRLYQAPCTTQSLKIHGYTDSKVSDEPLGVYGSDAVNINKLCISNPELTKLLHPKLPYIAAEIVWAAREEMCRSVDDALSRRTRALQLDAKAAIETAPIVANLLAAELGREEEWISNQVESFTKLAQQYLVADEIK
jgi:glycerol-3-phosphate dehydrogenase